MTSLLDPPRWAKSPETALRIAAVVFCAGATVPALSCCSLVRMAFCISPVAPWLTAATTGFFAYWVLRLSPRRAFRAPAVFAMSAAGGALNGLVAGLLSGLLGTDPSSTLAMAIYGTMFGIAYGLAFGVANAVLVGVSRWDERPSVFSRGGAGTRLSATVGVLLCLAFVILALQPEASAPQSVLRNMTPAKASLLAALAVSAAVTCAVLVVAIRGGLEQRGRARWLARIARGVEPGYRLVPVESATLASSLPVFVHVSAGVGESVIVRVEQRLDAGGVTSAYRQADHLSPIARLAR